MTGQRWAERQAKKYDVRFSSFIPGADNEQIDADLAREYGSD
jgi:hypothetical protein